MIFFFTLLNDHVFSKLFNLWSTAHVAPIQLSRHTSPHNSWRIFCLNLVKLVHSETISRINSGQQQSGRRSVELRYRPTYWREVIDRCVILVTGISIVQIVCIWIQVMWENSRVASITCAPHPPLSTIGNNFFPRLSNVLCYRMPHMCEPSDTCVGHMW